MITTGATLPPILKTYSWPFLFLLPVLVDEIGDRGILWVWIRTGWRRIMGRIAKIMLQGTRQANRQAQLDILARAGKAELHACRGSNVHACRGSGMECRGSARRGGGGTGAHTGPSHWVNQISLDLPRASDPVWVAGRSL